MIRHVISVSGGKDSLATLLIAIKRFGRERILAIFCDTGNENSAVYEYLNYLELALGIVILRLKADFSEEIAAKRVFVSRDVRTKRVYDTVDVFDADGSPVWARDGFGNMRYKLKKNRGASFCEFIQKQKKIGGGHKIRWSNKAKRRALAVLHPTGNPFLDLCLWKGRFPSRKAQFCTEELKTAMAVSYQLGLIDEGYTVISWQGVRRDESLNRRDAKKFERIAPALYAFRPLVDWSALDVFAYCAAENIQPNPLYKQGMSRVGCMPCINVNKAELREIARRFPDEINRIHEWENLVAAASKRQASTFIPAPGIKKNQAKQHGIWQIVEWSKTTRGGRQFDLLADVNESTVCASAYGLCE